MLPSRAHTIPVRRIGFGSVDNAIVPGGSLCTRKRQPMRKQERSRYQAIAWSGQRVPQGS